LLSSLIKESGINCTLEVVAQYHLIRGTDIEVAMQNAAGAYLPIAKLVVQKNNETTNQR
jgi:hypothetical protein